MNRRSFLTGMAGILAAGAAPAIITTPGLLMPIRKIWVPPVPEAISIPMMGIWHPPTANAYDPLAQRGIYAIRCIIDGKPYIEMYGVADLELTPTMERQMKEAFHATLRGAGIVA